LALNKVDRVHKPDLLPLMDRYSKLYGFEEIFPISALRGEGLVMKSMWDVYEDVEAKRLKIVLPELRLAAAPIHALYPHGKLAAAKVRLCVDYLAAALKERAAVLPAGP